MQIPRRPQLLMLLALVCFLAGQCLVCAHTTIDVKDYGAVGDGVHDDTLNIQAAINASNALIYSAPSINTGNHYTMPEVFFPHGRYRITNTLAISSINLVGEGNAIIRMTTVSDANTIDLTKDLFSGETLWRMRVSGFTFYGGRHQFYIGNPNWDSGHIMFEKCDFYSCAGVAIYMRPGTASTLVDIKGCMFMGCDQVLINHCDECRLSDSTINTPATMSQKAAIVNYGSLFCEGITGIPHVTPANDQRWIDNHFEVYCHKFRFGGNDGGMTPVVNFSAWSLQLPNHFGSNSVILENCDVFTGGNNKRACIVSLEAVPNQLVINNCRVPSVPFISWNPSLDLTTALANAPWWAMNLNTLRNTVTSPWYSDLPGPMRPYQEGDILGDAQPTSGAWRRGQFVRNRNLAQWQVWTPNATPPNYGAWTVYNNPFTDAKLAPYGWLCTADGAPGTWQTVLFKY